MKPSGSLTLGPGRPYLVLFFTTWLTETSDLRAQLLALRAYAHASRRGRLPRLTAVDEAASEPSPGAARAYLAQLGKPLGYPVAVDATGRLADGYGVADQPWFVLTSATGKIVWKHDGWLPSQRWKPPPAKPDMRQASTGRGARSGVRDLQTGRG